MAVTESIMVKLGSEMPEFSLRDVVSGETVSFEDYEDSKAILVIFLSQHCPYVAYIADEIGKLAKYYDGSGLSIIGISSNDADNYPEDAPTEMADMAEEYDLNFPILYDQSQDIAKDFNARCTPDFFLYNSERKLVYRGQFDDSRPENKAEINGADLRAAIDAVLAGKKPKQNQKPSSGCSIKWKLGNEPAY
jgi:peroxiredoxin